jgi:hypothetical protein
MGSLCWCAMRVMTSAREKDVRWFAQTHLVEDTVLERNVRVCVPPRPRGIIRTSLSHSTGSVTFFNFVVVSGCSLDAGAAACPSPSAAVRAMTVGVRCARRVRPQPTLTLLSFCCRSCGAAVATDRSQFTFLCFVSHTVDANPSTLEHQAQQVTCACERVRPTASTGR